jgi:subtilisin family serine protease
VDYRPIKITFVFLLIISSLTAFYTGLCSGFPGYALSEVNTNSEPVVSNAFVQTGGPAASRLEYQSINDSDYPDQFQHIDDMVDEIDNTIRSLNQYPIMHSRDFLNQQVLAYDYQVIVAILDTGIDTDHEALCSKVSSEIDFTDSPAGALDNYGHGTPVAGIIAAGEDKNPVMQGVASNCCLLNIKVVDDQGRYDMADLVDGIRWAVDNGANVINISLVSGEKSTELEEAVNYAWENGVVIVAAAGNGGTDTPVYPAAYEHCIAVTAVDDNGNLIPLANYGDWVDIAAPGYRIYSTLPGSKYGYVYGTSFATAYISSLAATIFPLVQDSNNDGKYNDEVTQLILNDFPDYRAQLVQN